MRTSRSGLSGAVLAAAVLVVGATVWLVVGGDTPPAATDVPIPEPPMPTGARAVRLPAGESELESQPLLEDVAHPTPAPTSDETGDDGVVAATLPELTLTGRVVDERRVPIEGAAVYLHPSRPTLEALGLPTNLFRDDPPWDRLTRAVSNAKGRFALTGFETRTDEAPAQLTGGSRDLVSGTALIVHCPGYCPKGVSVPLDGSRALDLGDLMLPLAGVLVGRVVDSGFRPLAGATVSVPPMGRSDSWANDDWGMTRTLVHATSAPDGRFRLDTAWPGALRVDISLPGKRTWNEEHAVMAGEITDLGDVVLTAGGVIHGQVVDADGQPLPGVSIKARPKGMFPIWPGEDVVLRELTVVVRSTGAREVNALTDIDGRFVFDDLDAKPYRVIAALEGHEPVLKKEVATNGEPLLFTLQPEALVVLTLVDATTGVPLEGAAASVRRRSSATDDDPGGSMDPQLETLTGSEAAARLGVEEPGHGLVVAGPAGFVRHEVVASAPGHAALAVDLPGVEVGGRLERTLKLQAGAALSGRVLDGDGRSLAGASVSLRRVTEDDIAKTFHSWSDTEGHYRFDELFAGTWQLAASLPGHAPPEPQELVLEAVQQLTEVDIVLAVGAALHGIVYGQDGLPARGTVVRVRPGDREPDRQRDASVQADTQGRFRFEGLAPGAVVVTAHPGAEAHAHVALGEDPSVELWLRVLPNVRGQVLGSAGAAAEVRVEIRYEGEPWPEQEVDTNARGEYAFEGLRPGRAVLVASDDRSLTPAVPMELDYGADEVVDLRFASGIIRGHVADATTDEPVPDLRVDARMLDFEPPPGIELDLPWSLDRTDERGRFEIGRLQPGRYRVSLRSREYVLADRESIEVVVGAEVVECTLRVVVGGVLTGRVVTTGVPEDKKLGFYLRPVDGGEEIVHAVPWEGEYRATGIPTGRYRFEVRRMNQWPRLPDQDHVFASGEVAVEAGETVRLDLLLVPMDG